MIGSGTVARGLVARIADHAELELAFLHARSPERSGAPAYLHMADLARAADLAPDLVVEAAHPVFSVDHGPSLLTVADYLPLSVSALADEDLLDALVRAGEAAGHRLWLPRGALVGLDSLAQSPAGWSEVTVTFEKHPSSLDLSLLPGPPPALTTRTTVFDGVVADVAPLLPRNVNAMVALAIATVGPRACRARVVADPTLAHGVLDVLALGPDGSRLHIRREQPMSGVSGTEMLASAWSSVLHAARAEPTLALC